MIKLFLELSEPVAHCCIPQHSETGSENHLSNKTLPFAWQSLGSLCPALRNATY